MMKFQTPDIYEKFEKTEADRNFAQVLSRYYIKNNCSWAKSLDITVVGVYSYDKALCNIGLPSPLIIHPRI